MSSVTATSSQTSGPTTIRRAALLIPSAATLLALMNYTAPMTVVPVIATGLDAGATGHVWILSTISVGLSTSLLAVGGLADRLGRRRVFVAGAVLLAIASTACALASDSAVLYAGHVAQGIASAALLAAGLGIVAHSFPVGRQRAHATGIWGAMLGAGIALGPLASSVLADVGGWRLWYWCAAAAAVVLGAAAARTVPESRAENARRTDVPGMLSMAGAIVTLVCAVTLARGGWGQPIVIGLLTSAAVLLAGFVYLERRSKEPLLELALFGMPGFIASLLGALVTGIAIIGLMSSLAAVLQRVHQMTALQSALVLSVWSGLSFVSALQTKRLVTVLAPRLVLAFGLGMCGLGELGLLGLGHDTSLTWAFLGLAIAGIGSGLANASLAALAVDSVPPERAGMGSGANNTARYLGASIGIAMVISITQSGPNGANVAVVVSAVLSLAGAASIALIRARR